MLVLNEENQEDNRVTFQDIEVDIDENELKTKTYEIKKKITSYKLPTFPIYQKTHHKDQHMKSQVIRNAMQRSHAA